MKLVNTGKASLLDALLASWLISLRVGLYSVDVPIVDGTVIDDLTPADFSGYVGLRDLTAWHAPSFVGVRRVVTHALIDWTHDAGVGSSWVFGYYVIDRADQLVWAERSFSPPLLLADAGAFARVAPSFTDRSEF